MIFLPFFCVHVFVCVSVSVSVRLYVCVSTSMTTNIKLKVPAFSTVPRPAGSP